jgi:Icc-related predicted phosphoesterase
VKTLIPLAEIYDKIPLDTDILLTHTPPHGILDLTKKGKNAGCWYLEGRLGSLEACKLHVFGWVHLENDCANTSRTTLGISMKHLGQR